MQTAVLNQVTVQLARRETAATCRTAPTLFRARVRMDLLIAGSGVMNVTPRQSRGQRRTRMVTFTINEDNHITAFAGAQEAAQTSAATATSFDSQAALAKVSGEWPLSRFVEIWNSVPGNSEVKKFSDRKKAVARRRGGNQCCGGSGRRAAVGARPPGSSRRAGGISN